jgi:hypothetical protein
MNMAASAFRIHYRYQTVVITATVGQYYPEVRSRGFLSNVVKCVPDRTASIPAHSELKN